MGYGNRILKMTNTDNSPELINDNRKRTRLHITFIRGKPIQTDNPWCTTYMANHETVIIVIESEWSSFNLIVGYIQESE